MIDLRFVGERAHDKMVSTVKEQDLIGKIKADHHQEHRNRAEQGIEEKLNSGVFTSRTSPNANEEVHWQKHQLPKDIEKEKIECAERTHHSDVEQEVHNEVTFDVAMNRKTGHGPN